MLLDLPVLALSGVYLPAEQAARAGPPHDRVLSDTVLQIEPYRVYAAAALRAGRLPLWSPLGYAGSPFLAANQSAVLSPYRIVDVLWPGYEAIAWGQLLRALVAGLGAFLYFRRAVGAGTAASVAGGWCFPLGGYLTLWSGFPLASVASWLPWAMLAADLAVRSPLGLAPVGLAAVTAAALVSGHSAAAVHVVFAALLQGACRAFALRDRAPAIRGVLALLAGVAVGVMIAAPQLLPTAEYLRTSARMHGRAAGVAETEPGGLAALPQVALPYFRGSTQGGGVYLGPANQLESAATAFPGLLVALVAAPLALAGPRRRYAALAAGLVVLGLASVTGLPVLARALDAWPLGALRNDRLTLVAGFGLLLLAVLGIDAIASAPRPGRRFALLAALPALVLGIAALRRALAPPPALAEATASLSPRAAEAARAAFVAWSGWGAALCAMAVVAALGVWTAWSRPATRWALALACAAELALTARAAFPLSDPSLYYPRLPVLQAIASAPPGRVCGVGCLPPNLAQTHGLRDVRGYDAADPERMVELVGAFAAPGAPPSPSYARTLFFTPQLPSPIADLLGVRYLIYRGAPAPELRPIATGDDYYAVLNPAALPRAFVPARVQVEADAAQRLRLLADRGFHPQDVAYVEAAPGPLPAAAQGRASVMRDDGERLTIAVDMATDGLLVVADAWDPGWRAFVDGRERPVLRVDHALRGIVVPRGTFVLEMRYEPAGFRWGVRMAALGLVLLGAGAIAALRRARATLVAADLASSTKSR